MVPVYAGYDAAEVRRALKRKEEPNYTGTFTSARRYVLHTFATTQSALMKRRVSRYMESGEFSRGKESIRGFGGIVMVGNFDVDVEHQQRVGHLFGPMPPEMRDDTAFMDRIHAFLPGWDVPKINKDLVTNHFGLVSDFLSGVFMIVEDQYGVGDVVDLGEAIGTVEHVGLRVTRVRDVDGTVWYVRNGEILRVGNQSQNWARSVLDVTVGYGEDLDKVVNDPTFPGSTFNLYQEMSYGQLFPQGSVPSAGTATASFSRNAVRSFGRSSSRFLISPRVPCTVTE